MSLAGEVKLFNKFRMNTISQKVNDTFKSLKGHSCPSFLSPPIFDRHNVRSRVAYGNKGLKASAELYIIVTGFCKLRWVPLELYLS